MAWVVEPLKYLEIIHTNNDGMVCTESRRFDPRHVINASFHAFDDDVRVDIELYPVEHLKQSVSEIYENRIVIELFIGIRDGRKIDYIGKRWTSRQSAVINIEQYFFKKGKPSSYDFGYRYGTGWPLDRSPALDERLRVYFTDLISRTDIGKSLSTCISKLEKPGPEYKEMSDGSILFDMIQN
jgi:hypothetical protein